MSTRTLQEMEFLYGAARRAAEGGDLQAIITFILDLLSEKTGFSSASLAIQRSSEIDIQTADGCSADELRPALERVIRRSSPLTQAGFSREKLISLAPGMTFIAVPILHNGKAAGALAAQKRGIANRDELEHEAEFLSAAAELIAGTLLNRLQQESSLSELKEENSELRRTLFRLEEQGRSSEMIGNSAAVRQVFREIAQVAHSDTTVLILGETGTGKELAARAVHEKSSCSKGPFVALNCGAFASALLESELFGHEKGAFTGALSARVGRFEEADGGTLFLDEVGELTPDAQTRLLRVIQEKVVQRIGGGKPKPVSVRLICATNRDLQQAVAEGRFREDLYYRINVFPIVVPPLRNRRDDIPLLAEHYLKQADHRHHASGYQLTAEALAVMQEYSWPGNIRELANTIERAALVTATGKIGVEHLPYHVHPAVELSREMRSLESRTAEYEKEIIEEALRICKGNQSRAAEYLGTTKRILQYKINRSGLDYRRFRKS